MKDKIFLPSVIVALFLLIIFMLICIKTQTSLTKDLSNGIEEVQKKIENIKTENMESKSINQGGIKHLETKINAIRTEVDRLTFQVGAMQRELAEFKKNDIVGKNQ